jgi:hypothetical protein
MEALTGDDLAESRPRRHHRLGRQHLIISDLIINLYSEPCVDTN